MGVKIRIQNLRGQRITWGNLRDVLMGLKLYLVEGHRSRVCHFQFSTGGDPDRIGQGMIVRSTTAVEDT